ncbi:MAG: phosphotransferase family protein [Candidatus Nitrosocosmicus sp.]
MMKNNFVNSKSIVMGDLQITDISRKNRNILLLRKNATSYLVKQSDGIRVNKQSTVETEFLLYKLIEDDQRFSSLIDFFPKAFKYDKNFNILVVEFIRESISFHKNNYNPQSENINEFARLLGKIMSLYHGTFSKLESNEINFLPKMNMDKLNIVTPLVQIFEDVSPANLEFFKIIQKHQVIHNAFQELPRKWKCETLIHGDFKWDNVIVQSSKTSQNKVKIVDWEYASLGDTAWDIGAALRDFLVYWIEFLPMEKYLDVTQLVNSTNYPLQRIKNSIRSYWKGYIMNTDKSNNQQVDLLIRSVSFCAIHLILKVFEMHQFSPVLTNKGIYMTQLAINMMTNLEKSIIYLLGIPLQDSI